MLKRAGIGLRSRPFPAVIHRVIPGDELLQNIYEAIEACLSVDTEEVELKPDDKVLEIAV